MKTVTCTAFRPGSRTANGPNQTGNGLSACLRLVKCRQLAGEKERSMDRACQHGNQVLNATRTPCTIEKQQKSRNVFSSVAPSYQRQFIVWIATAKRPETKKRRLDEAIELLGRGEKLGMR